MYKSVLIYITFKIYYQIGFWNKYSREDELSLRTKFKDIYLDLEDRSYIRPAWRKEKLLFSPDIETQNFMGDLMLGNIHLNSRIPANWNDEE